MNKTKQKYLHKLIISILLIQIILFPTLISKAETIQTTEQKQKTQTQTEQEQTNYTIPGITADAYYVMDNKTNKVLYKHNENKKMYPASTTKIVTAIVVLEHANLDDKVTADYDSLVEIPEGYAVANVQYGETLTVEQLLELLLIPSCNDVANMLAVHVGGSIESFVSMMNTKIHDLGLTGTHFTNPYGRHDENHYTTAHDLSILFQHCMKNNTFRKITGKATCSIPATNKSDLRTYESTNKLIIPGNPNYYNHITCGKTGFTTPAKECLVSSSYNNNLEIISTILGSTDRFTDTKKIYKKAYSTYSIRNIITKGNKLSHIEIKNGTKETKELDLIAENDINVLLNNNIDLSTITPEITTTDKTKAPIYKNDVIGTLTYTIDNTKYTCNLLASHDVEKSNTLNYILYTISFLLITSILYYLYRIIQIHIITDPNYLLEESTESNNETNNNKSSTTETTNNKTEENKIEENKTEENKTDKTEKPKETKEPESKNTTNEKNIKEEKLTKLIQKEREKEKSNQKDKLKKKIENSLIKEIENNKINNSETNNNKIDNSETDNIETNNIETNNIETKTNNETKTTQTNEETNNSNNK